MIDLKILRENPERLRKAVSDRGDKTDIDGLIAVDLQRRQLITRIDGQRKERHAISEKVGRLIKQGGNAAALQAEARALAEEIKQAEQELKELEAKFYTQVSWLPNIPHESVPVGTAREANRLVRGLKTPPHYGFKPLPHWEIGEGLDLLDLKRATQIAGSRFILYTGDGALLERALVNFFLDLHTAQNGYREIFPPVLTTANCLYGTGQLPKLEAEMYKTSDDFYLIPTAEVPLTNLHRDSIIPEKDLPLKYVAYTPCFRREAGSYGKEVRGITRVHQFNKVELVKYATVETGYDEFEKLLADAEGAVKLLGLPYRIVLLSTGDMTFASAKTYDIEVYAPGMGEWLEVSSVSCYEQYQARRAGIRYRRTGGGVEYVYTINGSGLATPRVFIGIVENCQTKDGRVKVPEVLIPYVKKDYLG